MQELHHQISETASRDIEVENRYGVWMIDAAGRDPLDAKSIQTLQSIAADGRPEDLDRHRMMKKDVLAAIHGAESAGADLFLNTVLVIEHCAGKSLRQRGENQVASPRGSDGRRSLLGQHAILCDQLVILPLELARA